MMEKVIETLTSNPVYLTVAVVLAVIILLATMKKLLKLVLVVGALLVLWIAYMAWTGQEVEVDKVKDRIKSGVESVGDKANELSEKAKKSAGKMLKEVGD